MNFFISSVLILTAGAGLFFAADRQTSKSQVQAYQTTEVAAITDSNISTDISADTSLLTEIKARQETDLDSEVSTDTQAAGYLKADISF